MAGWNGSGIFVRAFNWVADKAASIKIIAARMDGEFDNYKGGLENCLTRDGQTPPTADINWNNHQINNLSQPVNDTDAARFVDVNNAVNGSPFRKNVLINGCFDVWQNGTSVAGTALRVRTADCWWAVRGGAATGYTVSLVASASAVPNAIKWQRNNADASAATMQLGQSVETVDALRFISLLASLGALGNTVLSFYVKKGANYSGGNLTVNVIGGSGANQNVLDGYTGAATRGTASVPLTAAYVKQTVAVALSTGDTEFGVQFVWTPTGVAGADDSVSIFGVQLEAAGTGSLPTQFDILPFSQVLLMCQRYFEKSFPYATVPAQNAGVTNVWRFPIYRAGAVGGGPWQMMFCAPKRVAPTVTTFNPSAANANVRDTTAGADCSATGTTVGESGFSVSFNGAAGSAIGNAAAVHWTAADVNF